MVILQDLHVRLLRINAISTQQGMRTARQTHAPWSQKPAAGQACLSRLGARAVLHTSAGCMHLCALAQARLPYSVTEPMQLLQQMPSRRVTTRFHRYQLQIMQPRCSIAVIAAAGCMQHRPLGRDPASAHHQQRPRSCQKRHKSSRAVQQHC